MMWRKGTKKRRPMLGVWVALIVVFMAELLVYSWCRIQYVQTGFEITQARQERERLVGLQRELKIEEGRLKSPEIIREKAEALGLVMPDSRQVIVIP